MQQFVRINYQCVCEDPSLVSSATAPWISVGGNCAGEARDRDMFQCAAEPSIHWSSPLQATLVLGCNVLMVRKLPHAGRWRGDSFRLRQTQSAVHCSGCEIYC